MSWDITEQYTCQTVLSCMPVCVLRRKILDALFLCFCWDKVYLLTTLTAQVPWCKKQRQLFNTWVPPGHSVLKLLERQFISKERSPCRTNARHLIVFCYLFGHLRQDIYLDMLHDFRMLGLIEGCTMINKECATLVGPVWPLLVPIPRPFDSHPREARRRLMTPHPGCDSRQQGSLGGVWMVCDGQGAPPITV